MASEAEPTPLTRALAQRDARAAWTAAGTAERVSRADSLALVLLLAHTDPLNRYGVAAARWVARYTIEMRTTVDETALISSQFVALQTPARRNAIHTLGAHFAARAQRDLADVARSWDVT